MIEIIPNKRALYIADINAVIIADLHMGYEYVLRKEGIKIPKINTFEEIKSILNEKNADKLIILGDVKHSIGEFMGVKKLQDLDVDIYIAKGNHDGNLENALNAKISGTDGFRIGNFGFVHGHSWPSNEVMEARYVFMGHVHPEIELRDSIGKAHRYPCHLVGHLTKSGRKKYEGNPRIFVVSAFNPLAGSNLANPIGPLFKNKIIGDFDVYLINGTYLGKMEALQY